MMDRRCRLLTTLASILAAPLRSQGQPRAARETASLPRAAFVGPTSEQDSRAVALIALFRKTLRAFCGHAQGIWRAMMCPC